MLVGGARIFTVERPWLDNQPNISCIPLGEYLCLPRRYFRGGYESWEVQGVDGRSFILIHKGNTFTDSAGCIIVGSRLSMLGGLWSVSGSARAYEHLAEIYEGEEFRLSITAANLGVMPDDS